MHHVKIFLVFFDIFFGFLYKYKFNADMERMQKQEYKACHTKTLRYKSTQWYEIYTIPPAKNIGQSECMTE